ncbi:hypothetical protein GCM10012275_61130 [Longimycelium tulufanense]|uniref:Uncharacterized protein n=1 Tax=Longimycelium tulufanense TaxID=907463 RepID=A0A8J3FYI2_9PSEU|nr:hypothetical protein [Longimycelium tulufanense]GGM82277.1 hypothetical protein GCM10012275_61130 [Longimycelium tulufanense]
MTTVTNPTALADQYDAATQQARRELHQAATRLAGRVTDGPLPAWLADHAAAFRLALITGQVRGCAHLADGPRVAHAAVWAPGYLVCPHCVAALAPDPVEDATCDRCRRPAGRLFAGTVALGPILLAYGLCEPCAAEVDTDPA